MNTEDISIWLNDYGAIAAAGAALLFFLWLLAAMARRGQWVGVTFVTVFGFGLWFFLLWLGVAVFVLPFVFLGGLFKGIHWGITCRKARYSQTDHSNDLGMVFISPTRIGTWVPKYPVNPDDWKDYENSIVPPDDPVYQRRLEWTPVQKVDPMSNYTYVEVDLDLSSPPLLSSTDADQSGADMFQPAPQPTPQYRPLTEPRPERKQSPLMWDE